MLHPRVKEYAEAANFAVISVILPSGRIGTWVMWIHADEDCLLIVTSAQSAKYRALLSNPSVTITIWQRDVPYNYVELQGHVTSFEPGKEAREMLEVMLARKYRGVTYLRPDVKEWALLRIAPIYQRLWCG